MSNTITREQFASAVASAISSVHHLYHEVDRLITGLRESLAEEPESLNPIRGTFGKSGRDQTRLIIRNEYGALFASMLNDEDGGDENEDDAEDEGDEVKTNIPVPRVASALPPEIASSQPLLAVRVVMYDPQKQRSFEPQIQYAVMSKWTVGKGIWTPDQRFLLFKSMLRRIPRALAEGASLSKGARIITKAKVTSVVGSKRGSKRGDERQLGCQLPSGVETVALYSLDAAEELDRLARSMKAMWSKAVNAS